MERRVRSRWIGQIQSRWPGRFSPCPLQQRRQAAHGEESQAPTRSAGNSRRHARDALAAAQPSCWWSPARLVGPGGGGGRSAQPVRQRPATPPLHNVGSLPQPPACLPACRRGLIAGLGSLHGRLPPAQGVHQAGHHVQGRAARAEPGRRCLISHSITVSVRGHHAWQPGQAEIDAGGGAPAADRPTARPLHSPEGPVTAAAAPVAAGARLATSGGRRLAARAFGPAEAMWVLRRRGRRRGRRGRPAAAPARRWCPWPSAAPSRRSARPRPGPRRRSGTARTSR